MNIIVRSVVNIIPEPGHTILIKRNKNYRKSGNLRSIDAYSALCAEE